jgi:hypothetical protein
MTTKTKVRISQKLVDASTVINMNLIASGGEAIWLTPQE